MRRGLVAGNWKMNGSAESVDHLIEGILSAEVGISAEILVLPPFPYLAQAQKMLKLTKILWGAQNVSQYENGAYTGEVSASMLRDFGCQYVIVGHSERRTLFGESSQIVAQKFLRALNAGLKPILCVGETQTQRAANQTTEIVQEQLAAVLDLTDNLPNLKEAVIAYEPVWAIGTGLSAKPDQAQEVHAMIRKELRKRGEKLAAEMRIIYGGSVKAENAATLFAMEDIDGALVGGASLIPQQFIEIARQCNN